MTLSLLSKWIGFGRSSHAAPVFSCFALKIMVAFKCNITREFWKIKRWQTVFSTKVVCLRRLYFKPLVLSQLFENFLDRFWLIGLSRPPLFHIASKLLFSFLFWPSTNIFSFILAVESEFCIIYKTKYQLVFKRTLINGKYETILVMVGIISHDK